MWILLLEQLTAAVSNCPRQHQPPTLELLFTLLREVTAVPGDAQEHSRISLALLGLVYRKHLEYCQIFINLHKKQTFVGIS